MPHFTAVAGLSLAVAFLSVPQANAEFRHYASQLVELSEGSETLHRFAWAGEGGVFVEAFSGGETVIVKLDSAGGVTWAKNLTVSPSVPSNHAIANGMAATGDGGVVLVGWFTGTVDFGFGPVLSMGQDVFLLKFDANGDPLWQRTFGFTSIQIGVDVAVDSNGTIVIVGDNFLEIDFGGGVIRTNGSTDVFVARFDGNGGHIWSRGLGRAGVQEARRLVIGDDHRMGLVIGFSSGAVDFGGGPILNRGGSDVAVALLDESGGLVWSLHAGSSLTENARDIALDPDGNAFVCGEIDAALDLGGGVLIPPTTAGLTGFVASYDHTGAYRWSYLIPDPVFSLARALDADAFGNCFVWGYNQGTVTFGLQTIAPSEGLLLGFGALGQPIAAAGYDNMNGFATVLRFDRERDRLRLAAWVDGPIDFGGGVLEPSGVSIALATMGVKRPPQVAINDFTALAMNGEVRIAWDLEAGEPLDQYYLTRRTDQSSSSHFLRSESASVGAGSFIDRSAAPGHVYTYRLLVTTALGEDVASNAVSVTLPPAATYLEQNAPNPFNPLTTFGYSLAEPARVAIVIYDQKGALVSRLDQGMQPAGKHTASWGGHNRSGEFVASGVYFYRLEGVPGVGARKMILLK